LTSKSGINGNYKETVIEIAKKRIELSDWPSTINFQNLFDNWKTGKKIRDEEVKKLAQEEYDKMNPKIRPDSFNSFWAKQGDAKYFRYLKSKKIMHRYGGPNTIVDISSGIFRQFLEICSKIVSSALDRNWRPDKEKKIGIEVQNDEIRLYAKEMLEKIKNTSGNTSYFTENNYIITSKHLYKLTISLLGLFRYKLYYGNKDAEVLAFSIKDDSIEKSFAKTILDVAVQASILQRRSIDYSSKNDGSEKLPTFFINKRLAPHYNLGLKMQGRYELTLADIELATKSSEKFLDKFCNKKKSQHYYDPEQESLL